jgi:transcriptional regulator with XRE-family HTH domain
MEEQDHIQLSQLGNRLRTLRLAKDYSQEKLAELTCLDRTYISGLERGKRNPSYLILRKLAEVLTVTPNQLFSEETR